MSPTRVDLTQGAPSAGSDICQLRITDLSDVIPENVVTCQHPVTDLLDAFTDLLGRMLTADTRDVGSSTAMYSDPFQRFIRSMDDLAGRDLEAGELAAGAARKLPMVLAEPGCLPSAYRAADPDRYRQHIVYVHPEGRYSVVSLVWLPGQATPVHDHRCWCVVGVLEGVEHETRYTLCHADGKEWLRTGDSCQNPAGSVSTLVPPAENIHQVANCADTLTISIHVYGADIGIVGNSINQVFTQPIDSPAWVSGPVHPGASAMGA